MPRHFQRWVAVAVLCCVFVQIFFIRGFFVKEIANCFIPTASRGQHYNETGRVYMQMASTGEVRSSSLKIEKDGSAHLTHLSDPDIALVLKINNNLSHAISKYVKKELPGFAYIQDPNLYHITLLHLKEKHLLNKSISEVIKKYSPCKISIQVDRVVVTSSGAVICLWQFLMSSHVRSTDPYDLRQRLSFELSAAIHPLNPFIFHTTLARFPSLQNSPHFRIDGPRIATRLNRLLCGFSTDISSLWLVREYDKMALALHGKFDKQIIPFKCA